MRRTKYARWFPGLALVACHSTAPVGADAALSSAPATVDAVLPPAPSAAASAAAATSASASTSKGRTIITLAPSEADTLAHSIVDGGAPSHPFFLGDFGPSPRTAFGLLQTDTMSPYTPVAATMDDRGLFSRVAIEPLTDTSWNGWQIDAVMFEDVDGSGKLAPIVIAELMTGIGPEGAKPFSLVIVYRWTGTKFVHAKAVEKKLTGATDASEVRKRLDALKKSE